MASANFHLETRPLNIEYSKWGEIGVIPWDSAIFGFPVAAFQAGNAQEAAAQLPAFRQSLLDWAQEQRVELVSCHLPAESVSAEAGVGSDKANAQENDEAEAGLWRWVLSQSGWTPVEQALRVTLNDLQNYETSNDETTLRLATPEDCDAVEQIAQNAFRHGRYSADPLFPRDLANLRYKQWIRSAFEAMQNGDEATRIYVVGARQSPHGFMHIETRNGVADIRLNAIDVSRAPKGSGRSLYQQTLSVLKAEGIRRVTAKISSSNVPVVNLYAKLRFRFSEPEWIFHWHAPNAPHLIHTA